MIEVKVASPLKILLALDDAAHLFSVTNMLTHIKWPAGTAVHMLAVVPDKLPQMDTSPAARRDIDETTEIARWRSWAAAKILANETASKLADQHFEMAKAEICQGHLADVVQESAAAMQPDLVVMSGKKFDAAGGLLPVLPGKPGGATARQPAVLVVRPSAQICPLNTILAVDGSPEAWRAVKFVCSLSLPDWAKVTVISVANRLPAVSAGSATISSYKSAGAYQNMWPEMPTVAEALATEAVNYMRDRGISVRWCCRSGSFASEVLSLAQEEEADLIVTGTKTKKSASSMRRSDAAQVLVKDAPCSVLVVR